MFLYGLHLGYSFPNGNTIRQRNSTIKVCLLKEKADNSLLRNPKKCYCYYYLNQKCGGGDSSQDSHDDIKFRETKEIKRDLR